MIVIWQIPNHEYSQESMYPANSQLQLALRAGTLSIFYVQ